MTRLFVMAFVGFYVVGLPLTFVVSMAALLLHFWSK